MRALHWSQLYRIGKEKVRLKPKMRIKRYTMISFGDGTGVPSAKIDHGEARNRLGSAGGAGVTIGRTFKVTFSLTM